ncbi:MAG: ATP-dependent helicase [Burkholderiales bacterium]|nr:MAG: ATP-dependent helicase [Burkholderiales bacterium]
MTRNNTQEQQAVIDSDANLLAVDAFAGTGKTSTLVKYAEARPSQRILYIAFNKSVAAEAKERFPENVDCRTTHSLAYAAVGRKFAEKLGNAQPYMVAQAFKCNTKRAKLALEAVSSWLCSIDAEITLNHINQDEVQDPIEADALVDLARNVWERMQDPRSDLKMPHDGYLKLWAMGQPRLRYDIILLDEAQDTNPITLDLVMSQQGHAKIVLVGDRHQGIYGFRKAMNAMEAVEAQERVALTQSFRFAQGIADVATALLQAFKGEDRCVKGRSDISVKWSIDYRKHYAIIGRTNAGLFSAAANVVMGRRERRLHFVGGFDSYLFGKVLDAYYLWADERARIKDATIARFQNFHDFKQYGDEAGDAEVKALVKTVEQYRMDVPVIYNAMRAAETPVQDRADITLTTGHRAKGLEWDQVMVADDFIELPPGEDDFDEEEVNLLYVGVTRAIESILLPGSLREWLESTGFDFNQQSECEQSETKALPHADVAQSEELRRLITERALLAEAITDAAQMCGLFDSKASVPDFNQLQQLIHELGRECLRANLMRAEAQYAG